GFAASRTESCRLGSARATSLSMMARPVEKFRQKDAQANRNPAVLLLRSTGRKPVPQRLSFFLCIRRRRAAEEHLSPPRASYLPAFQIEPLRLAESVVARPQLPCETSRPTRPR